jgi:hypothetical protein
VEKIGIYYAPLYLGGDDMEYNQRIERVKPRPYVIDKLCEHPFFGGDSIFRKFDRYWLYLLHAILFSRDLRFFAINFANLLFTSLVLLLFFPPYGRAVAGQALSLLLSYTYGKSAISRLKFDLGAFITDARLIDRKKYIIYSDAERIRGFGESFRLFVSNFGRKFLILRTNHVFKAVTLGAIFSGEIYFMLDENRYLKIAKRGSAPGHVIRVLAFIAILPIYAAVLSMIFLPMKLLRQPDTWRYGL